MKRLAALLSLFLLLPGAALAQDITVFAAASLRGALDEIAEGWSAPVRLSYGGSGTIARQVAAGAPADVVILAHADWMDWLAARMPLAARTTLAGNRLALIGPEGADPLTPDQLFARLGTGRLAVGQREAVPAGAYARQWLRAAGLWDRLEPKLAETDTVRAALALVAQGAAPFGIVYASDALSEPRVRVLYAVPDTAHDPILYPAAAISPAGGAFIGYLASEAVARTLARHGFVPVKR